MCRVIEEADSMADDVTTVSRDVLYDQVWSMQMTKLAKEYGVSDVALRKTCRKENIPLPVQGHWNKPPERRMKRRPPLPPEGSGHSIRITRSPPARPADDSHPAVEICAQALASGDARIVVTDNLRDLHPAVWPKAARKAATSAGHPTEVAKTLPVNVGKEHAGRALRILDALAKALEARGYPVTADGARIEEQLVPIAIMEQQDKVLHVPTARELAAKMARSWEKIPTWDYVPSGRLSIHSDVYIWWRRDLRKRWSDSRRTRLEDTLDDAFLGLVALGAAKKQKADEEQAEAERRAEQERQSLERERQARMSAARDKDILERARALDEAASVRRLIAAVEQSSFTGSDVAREVKRWLDRAQAVAASLDPLTSGLEHMLARHETMAEEAGAPPPPKRWTY
jgi:hypothetical protein